MPSVETCQVKKDTCVATINVCDLPNWEAKGWARVDAVKAAKEPKAPKSK